MKIMKCLLIISAVSVLFACDGKKSVVQDVLDNAKRGEDTAEYWVGGIVKQKLYDVVEYEIMSDRPLKEAIREYVPKAMKSFDQSIEFSEKKIAQAEEKSKQLQELLPSLELMANVRVPSQEYYETGGNDTFGNYSRISNALMSYQEYFPKSDISEAIRNINSAKPLVVKSNKHRGKDNNFSTSNSLQEADRYIDMAWTKLSEVVSNNKKRHDSAVKELNAVPEIIESEEKNIAELENCKTKFEDFVNKANGVAYKVKINSKNKAGEPITSIWTITVIKSNEKWKVSHIYNEEVFDLVKEPILMVGELLPIVGWADPSLENILKIAKSKMELEKIELAKQKAEKERIELAKQKAERDNTARLISQQNYNAQASSEPRQPRRVQREVYGTCSCCYGTGKSQHGAMQGGRCGCCNGHGLRLEMRWVDQ